MGEIENNMMCKDGKIMHAFFSETIRGLVKKAQELEIPREDVVSVVPENNNNRYVLIYYK